MGNAGKPPLAPPTPNAAAHSHAWDHDDDDSPQCRVCWGGESLKKGGASLVSPCACTGTQAHVHLECLRRWQECLQQRDADDERAFRCSVCRALFSVPPPKPKGSGGGGGGAALRGAAAVACILLLAFNLAGPPWPHLALLLLLLLGSRAHWLAALALLVAGSGLATLHARGLRLVLRLDGVGRLGVALIRHGAPVPGLGQGVLLVASDGLDHSIFSRSVVLLTQHGRAGARGVMLTQPMPHAPTLPLAMEAAAAAAGSSGRAGAAGGVPLRHFLGGPVGMPGEGLNHQVLLLHSVPGVAGARRVLPPPAVDGSGAGGGGRAAAASASDGLHLFERGSLSEVLEKAAGAAEAAARGADAARGGRARRVEASGGAGGAALPAVLLFHGACAWAEGQLEGELRAGAWSFAPADQVAHVLSLPPEQMWAELAEGPHLARVR